MLSYLEFCWTGNVALQIQSLFPWKICRLVTFKPSTLLSHRNQKQQSQPWQRTANSWRHPEYGTFHFWQDPTIWFESSPFLYILYVCVCACACARLWETGDFHWVSLVMCSTMPPVSFCLTPTHAQAHCIAHLPLPNQWSRQLYVLVLNPFQLYPVLLWPTHLNLLHLCRCFSLTYLSVSVTLLLCLRLFHLYFSVVISVLPMVFLLLCFSPCMWCLQSSPSPLPQSRVLTADRGRTE